MTSPQSVGSLIGLVLHLCKLNELIQAEPAYRELLGKLSGRKQKQDRALILDAAKPFLIASLFQNVKRPILVVTAQPENAKKLYEQISLWCDEVSLNLFPESDQLAYQRSIPDFSLEQERLQVLYHLSKKRSGQALIITSVPAIVQKTLNEGDFLAGCSEIKCGDQRNPLELMRDWEAIGYRVENMVDTTGTISHRGDILDIFPPTGDLPVRLEFFGNTIESIREFDSSSQRSLKALTKFDICPASEVLFDPKKHDLKTLSGMLDLSNCNEETRNQINQDLVQISGGQKPPELSFYSPLFNSGSLFDYLPENCLLILDELAQVQQEAAFLDEESAGTREQKISSGELPLNFPRPYFVWSEVERSLAGRYVLNLRSWAAAENEELLRFNFIPAPSYVNQLSNFILKSSELMEREGRLILVSNQASRLSELYQESDIYSQPASWD